MIRSLLPGEDVSYLAGEDLEVWYDHVTPIPGEDVSYLACEDLEVWYDHVTPTW